MFLTYEKPSKQTITRQLLCCYQFQSEALILARVTMLDQINVHKRQNNEAFDFKKLFRCKVRRISAPDLFKWWSVTPEDKIPERVIPVRAREPEPMDSIEMPLRAAVTGHLFRHAQT